MKIPWDFFALSGLSSLLLSYFLAALVARRAKPVLRNGRPMPPELGGTVVFLALLLASLAVTGFYGPLFQGSQQKLLAVAASASAIFLLGLIDDWISLHYLIKLLGQILIAYLLPLAGFRLDFVTNLGGGALYLPMWAGDLLIVGWLVFVMNAVNLIDGLDGLAAGIVVLGSFTIFLLGSLDRPFVAAGALALASALLGILPFNFRPAKFYLGDSGSLFIGFLMGVYSLFFHVKTYVAIAVFVPVLVLFVPVLNTTMVMAGRLRRGRNPFKGDIFHLHYRLLRQGLSHRATVIFLWAVTGSLCALLVVRQALPFRPRTILFLSAVLVLYTVAMEWFLRYLKKKRHRLFEQKKH